MLNKNDFIEIEFTGKVKDGEIFDTNLEEQAKKLGINVKTRPLVICIGQNMILPAIDNFLIGKAQGKYVLELAPEKAFGSRTRELIKIMPISVFLKHKINPQAGMVFSFDNMMGKISAVSGGRVIVDFNNPLAGKEVVYELNIKRKVTDEKEKAKSLMLALFGRELDFTVSNKKLVIEATNEMKKFIELFKGKFKEILSLDLEVKEIEENRENKESTKEKKD